MGLDFMIGRDVKDCEAHWSYSGFHEFRIRLANAAGMVLFSTHGQEVTDPIEHLLNHSDCEGDLSPKQCRECAPRLRELLEKFNKEDWAEGYDYDSGIALAEGMEFCAENNETLIFC
jgi:hypothetical protein